MDIKDKLSINLKTIRLSKNLTQEEVGKGLGVKKQVISDYERGKTLPDLNSIIKLATFFKCSIDSLIFTGTDINIDELSTISSINVSKLFESLDDINSENKILIDNLNDIILNLEKSNLKQKEIISSIKTNKSINKNK